jgi:DNA repair protein RecO (recombination protein O)
MKKTEQGFVLQKIAYSETSFIVKMFTKNHGLKSFMVKGGNKKFSSIFQAMVHLEFTYYQKNEDQLANLYEPVLISNFQEIYFSPIKQSVVFFQAEFLSQCLQVNQEDKKLFDFISKELVLLNNFDFESNYLIYWTLELSDILGFKPQLDDEDGIYFDLINGILSKTNSTHSDSVQGETVQILAFFLKLERQEQLNLKLSKELRKQILLTLIRYFTIHIDTFKKIKSFEVYQTLWYD